MKRVDTKTYVIPDSIEKRSLKDFMSQEGADYLDAIISEFKLNRNRVRNLYTHKTNGCPFVGIEVILEDPAEKKKFYVSQMRPIRLLSAESMTDKLINF